MFIDIHVHTNRVPGPNHWGGETLATPEQLIARYDALGIERGVLLPLVSPEAMYGVQSNEEILEVVSLYPDRFIPFCNVDPRFIANAPDAPLDKLFAHYTAKGCKGIGEVTANLPFLDPMVQNLFKHVQDAGLPLTFHVAARLGGLYGLYDDPGLPQLERSLQLFPNLRFLAHSQTFWAEMAPLDTPGDRFGYPKYPLKTEGAVPKLFRRYPNLYGDLSANSGWNALNRDRAYAVQFLDEFQDRLLFGTDICGPSTRTPLVDLLQEMRADGHITEEVFQKIARENAVKLLRLEERVGV